MTSGLAGWPTRQMRPAPRGATVVSTKRGTGVSLAMANQGTVAPSAGTAVGFLGGILPYNRIGGGTAKPIGMAERAMKLMPAARDALPAGDFRDWPDIETWARSIAADLRSGGG